MRIAIDFFKQIKSSGKSIGIYNVTYNIINSISKIHKNIRDDVEIVVFCNKYNIDDLKGLDVTLVEIERLNPNKKVCCILWELLLVNKYLKKYKIDSVFFPRGYRPLSCKIPNTILVHDMIPFYYNEHYPNTFNKIENFYIMNRLKKSIETADQVITISEASKNDIQKYCKVNKNNISIIYNGIDYIESRKFNFPKENFIVAMTSKLPHKNLIGILKSYERYVNIESSPLELKIIGIDEEFLEKVINENGIDSKIISMIYCVRYLASNDELYTLISKAKVFLFLSLIEGFGLPPIEAMAVSSPVICSNQSSLPEVVNDAGLLVNPNDYDEVANSIKTVVNNSELSNELINKGLKNVKRFNWDIQGEKYLHRLYSIYNLM